MALNVEYISVTKGKRRIVDDISIVVNFGRITGLLGPNGAGKTTLMHAICGLGKMDRSTSSKIILDEVDLTSASISDRVSSGLVYLPQQTSLFSSLSVRENLGVLLEFHPYWQHKQSNEFWEQADELLSFVQLQGHTHNSAQTLSGGQKRKLEVVRTLLMHPKVIICDEPFAGVDPKSISELQELFNTIATQRNIGFIVSDHNVAEILEGTQYIYTIFNGQVLYEGTPEQVSRNELVQQHYFGERFSDRIRK